MLPLLMLLLLLFLPVLIKLGNPLSRQKRGERCFIIKEERDTPANVAPVNEKYSRVLQDLEISITWQSNSPPPTTPPPLCEEDNTTAPPPSGCSFLVFLAGRADCRCCLRDKCSSTAFRFSCCPPLHPFFFLFFPPQVLRKPIKIQGLKTVNAGYEFGIADNYTDIWINSTVRHTLALKNTFEFISGHFYQNIHISRGCW